MQNTTTYLEQGRALLEQAYADLEADDLHQASGMGWEAAAHILQAVAEERGWEHDDYRLLIGVASKLYDETRSYDLLHGLGAAIMLYTNFHDGVVGREWVGSCLDRVRVFVETTAELLDDH